MDCIRWLAWVQEEFWLSFGCEIFWDCVDICILLPRMQILF